MILKSKIVAATRRPTAQQLDDFEERLMFGDLAALITEFRAQPQPREDMLRGLESLHYFRSHYKSAGPNRDGAVRGRIAALDAAWCMELIELARRERADRYYRA